MQLIEEQMSIPIHVEALGTYKSYLSWQPENGSYNVAQYQPGNQVERLRSRRHLALTTTTRM
jgi:hypothetical protein